MDNSIDVVLAGGIEAQLSYDASSKLLMIHSSFISGQWSVDTIAIILNRVADHCDIEIHSTRAEVAANYQRWIVSIEYYEPIEQFFRSLGFPCPTQPYIPASLLGTSHH